ncbi:unnamed protein product [Prorocentrum cordatum]|uniref:Uncharacterized protein n=1 Tax=Prorocentrum cordatum TaxID=2364126 RepID=A0ABN9QN99_9DINO|nr:unnamed protein product [Polarella glacialis]
MNQSAAGGEWEDSDLTVQVAESTEDVVVCTSTRLTKFFTGSYGSVLPHPFQLVCPDADIINTDALKALGHGTWWYKPAGLLMWLVLLIQIGLVVLSWRRQQRGAELHRSFNVEESAGSCEAARAESNMVNNSIFEVNGCSLDGLLLWLAANALGVEASPDELDGRPLGAAIRQMVHARCLLLSCQTDIGLSQAKVWHFRIASATSMIGENAKQQRGSRPRRRLPEAAECGSMGEVNRRMGDSIDRATQVFLRNPAAAVRDRLWTFFFAAHPLTRAICYSIVTPWIHRALALACSVLVPLAACALYVAHFARKGGEPLCERKDLAEQILRDMLPGMATAVLAKCVFWLLAGIHRRALVSSYVAFWMLRELIVLLLLVSLLAGSSCYVLAFLAGVTETDADHWAISCLTYFVFAWLLVPLASSLLWFGVALNLAGRDEYVEKAANLLRDNLGYARKRISADEEPSFDAFADDFPKPQMMPKGGMSGARMPEPPPSPAWGEAQGKNPPKERPPQPPGFFAIEAARRGNNANFWRWVDDLHQYGEDPNSNLPAGVQPTRAPAGAQPAWRAPHQQALPMPPPLRPYDEDRLSLQQTASRKGPPPPAPGAALQVRQPAANTKGSTARNPPGLSDEEVPVTPPGQPRPPPRRGLDAVGVPPPPPALPDMPRQAAGRQPPGFAGQPRLPELPGLMGSGDDTPPEVGGGASLRARSRPPALGASAADAAAWGVPPAPTVTEGQDVWFTDNRELQAQTDGVAFRYSPNLADTDGRFVVNWGSAVQGAVSEDGEWLKTEGGLYLPMRSRGKRGREAAQSCDALRTAGEPAAAISWGSVGSPEG